MSAVLEAAHPRDCSVNHVDTSSVLLSCTSLSHIAEVVPVMPQGCERERTVWLASGAKMACPRPYGSWREDLEKSFSHIVEKFQDVQHVVIIRTIVVNDIARMRIIEARFR